MSTGCTSKMSSTKSSAITKIETALEHVSGDLMNGDFCDSTQSRIFHDLHRINLTLISQCLKTEMHRIRADGRHMRYWNVSTVEKQFNAACENCNRRNQDL